MCSLEHLQGDKADSPKTPPDTQGEYVVHRSIKIRGTAVDKVPGKAEKVMMVDAYLGNPVPEG